MAVSKPTNLLACSKKQGDWIIAIFLLFGHRVCMDFVEYGTIDYSETGR
jgi:hypothetical protein